MGVPDQALSKSGQIFVNSSLFKEKHLHRVRTSRLYQASGQIARKRNICRNGKSCRFAVQIPVWRGCPRGQLVPDWPADFDTPLGPPDSSLLCKFQFSGQCPLTFRARCAALRYCPSPLGNVTHQQILVWRAVPADISCLIGRQITIRHWAHPIRYCCVNFSLLGCFDGECRGGDSPPVR